MSQPEHGIPVALRSVSERLVGKKLRLVGRMLWYEPASGFMALADGDRAVLVDISLCVNPRTSTWVRDKFCQLIVLGHLEQSEEILLMPPAPERTGEYTISKDYVLRAVLVVPDATLDVGEYNKFVEEGL